MALSNQQIQVLQKYVKDASSEIPTKKNSIIHDDNSDQKYQIINRTPGDPNSKDVTQAIAVAL